MSNGDPQIEPSADEVEYDFKKIEFERAFGHLAALDTRISIAVGVETLLVGLIILIISSVFEKKIPSKLFFVIPTSIPLGISLLMGFASMVICLLILSKKLDFKYADPNPNKRKAASEWIANYVKKASIEIEDRHRLWKKSLIFLTISIIIFSITAAFIVFQPVSPSESAKEYHISHFHNHKHF